MKTSKPEDEQIKCGLYAEILHEVHINPRHKRNQVLAIALHNSYEKTHGKQWHLHRPEGLMHCAYSVLLEAN